MKNIQKFRFGQIGKLESIMSNKFKKSMNTIRAYKIIDYNNIDDTAMMYYYKAIRQCTIMNACRKILCFKDETHN